MAKNSLIIQKIDHFIRKYYKNRLIKGVLYTIALLVSLFILLVLLEHFGYFSTILRTILFWFYLLAALAILVSYIALPILKMNSLGQRISNEEAARIIGRHFPEIKDRLLNLLQLQNEADLSSSDLLQAAIDQKTEQLSPIPFSNAISYKGNKKYIKFALIPVVLLLIILIASPSVITDSSKRIINHSTPYERPAPFSFVVDNPILEAQQDADFKLDISIKGESVPNEVFVNVGGHIYKMQKVDKTHFSYLFKNLRSTINFRLEAADVTSVDYSLVVNPNPTVVDFSVRLTYPAYIHKEAEELSNIGDFTVPEGTRVEWVFHTKDVDSLFIISDQKHHSFVPTKNGSVSYAIRAMQSFTYSFFASNAHRFSSDTLSYGVSVIQDAHPMIAVLDIHDSIVPDKVYFKGRLKDDYGFTRLEFKVEKTNVADTTNKTLTSTQIGLTDETSQEFYFSTNLAEISINPGDIIKYYFEVWDNDGIHGPKSTRSQVFEIEIPTDKELSEMLESNRTEIQHQGESSISELKKLQEDIQDMMQKMVDKKDLNWQDKKQLEELAKKQKQVKQMLQDMQRQINENNRLEEKYREQSQEIMEKQKELDRLIDQLMNDEMKEMMKQLDQMMKEVDKQKLQEELENMKLKNEDIQKQLDQNLELMRRLELEKRVEDVVKKAEDLAEKQKQLSDQVENAKSNQKDMLLEKQKELSKDYQDIRKEVEKIQHDYKNLDPSADFKVDKNLQQNIEQKQKDAENSLQKGKNGDASKQQKSAADDLEKLSQQLAESQMEMEQEELAEDAETVRRLLKNVVRLSFDQEQLIGTLNSIHIQDPKYQQVIADQNKVMQAFKNVEDSLRSMAKRQVSVASVINKDLEAVNSNISKSISGLLQMNQTFYGNSRNTQSARSMQYAMTSLNNLALVMAESLDKMQDQMRKNSQQQKSGNCKRKGQKKPSSCSNPGSGKPSPKSMKQMQEELNKQMQAFKKQLESQGKNPSSNRTKLGEKNSISEELARMAAQQEQIRRMMQEYGQEMKQQSGGNSKLAREIDEMMRQMEQTETDLVNKTITQQTIRRQQQIMTRLLEHEKAEMQREKEDRRESKEATDQYQPSQQDLEKFEKMQQKNIELFHKVPPTLSNFYKRKVDDYFFKSN